MYNAMEVKVLGKVIGMATGWDQNDLGTSFSFENFIPNELDLIFLADYKEPEADAIGTDLHINFDSGLVQFGTFYDSDEKPDSTYNITPNWAAFN